MGALVRPGEHPTYNSVLVVAATSAFRSINDLHRARFAYNDRQSLSGYHCMCGAMLPRQLAFVLVYAIEPRNS
jgi:ABC-type phosphate/phosphonate transport system substrate-binding protein